MCAEETFCSDVCPKAEQAEQALKAAGKGSGGDTPVSDTRDPTVLKRDVLLTHCTQLCKRVETGCFAIFGVGLRGFRDTTMTKFSTDAYMVMISWLNKLAKEHRENP